MTTGLLSTIDLMDLSSVLGGAGSDLATGGFWTGRTRADEECAARSGSKLGTGGFWTGRTREEQEDPKGWRERCDLQSLGDDRER
jgi:hypothetical protein